MESPVSFSTHSEAPQLSEDSGLLMTSGSFSSDSVSNLPQISLELQESDYDEKSLSFCESAEASERMCDNFNTVKKGKVTVTAIEPPLQFQDSPPILKQKSADESSLLDSEEFPQELIVKVETMTLEVPHTLKHLSPIYTKKLKCESMYERRQCLNHRFTSPRLVHLSPCRGTRPASRSSLSSRLSSSHNSLVTQLQADDSSFITQAISHDTLSSDILDMYNVPFDSDIYAVPVDMVRPNHNRHKAKKLQKNHRKRGKSACQAASNNNVAPERTTCKEKNLTDNQDVSSKRHSLPGPSADKSISDTIGEPMHMTLREVRKYLHTLYSSSSDSESKNNMPAICSDHYPHNTNKDTQINRTSELFDPANKSVENNNNNNNHRKLKKNNFVNNDKNKKHKDKALSEEYKKKKQDPKMSKVKSSPVKMLSLNLKQTFCNLFRFRRSVPVESSDSEEVSVRNDNAGPPVPVVRRALPPLPQSPRPAKKHGEEDAITDFATSIQKVKDYPWYWGPISVEAAEKILSNEPDGSFIVRDSSDDHYIFTLTFKLNGLRHVRIEHEQGNFCFGGCTMFKAQTIVEFIENAVETSRSGRYLFFLNLRPLLGPVRVQLLYPVSRFKRVQSLQHMCRFVILKVVRRDLVNNLPLPRRLLDYLCATHYYSELLADS